ncbi:HTH-type transcriptional regulator AcrR [Klebsiella variicola]|uniref:acrEF/envCD operon transcriptional regulator n=1 Tax=Klebsiella TaxID=570 RepID=UPI0007D0C2FD|nr:MULTISPECIES: acrEF/envCD operon transcriptional regulator [Klebsiella]PJR52976.1 acrEF/envCD operon transcriptional regulator [Klebsiella sp. I-Nf8]PJR59075.1 acrEF/envCD operon transcriptional regulator [Klebsiella sp. K-Nf6]PJX67206.1 acrEF/envCD operon transcriptional regulator [Klebsiella sp. G-Nf4]PJX71253.1 acrEF/envCD operon transcriptional regulator [Klebsiella sp. G2-16S-Nf13]PKJ72838.1 acrEF/envCD operon transcriptional regulator [Klebsiella sp. J-Nf11]
MARKTKEEALRTRQLLIESAIQQFALRGVANTTLTDIADAAGVTRGAVYWHFASKTALFNEMWQQQPPLRDLIQQSLATMNEKEPLNDLRQRFIAGLRYIAENPRQRALMQILYQRCEFASDMLSESEIRQRIGFNYSVIGGILQHCVRNNILPAETNIDVILIVLHSAFSGLIKNWLLDPQRFDLYQQAPALVDNIMAVVCAARLSQEPVLRVVNQ